MLEPPHRQASRASQPTYHSRRNGLHYSYMARGRRGRPHLTSSKIQKRRAARDRDEGIQPTIGNTALCAIHAPPGWDHVFWIYIGSRESSITAKNEEQQRATAAPRAVPLCVVAVPVCFIIRLYWRAHIPETYIHRESSHSFLIPWVTALPRRRRQLSCSQKTIHRAAPLGRLVRTEWETTPCEDGAEGDAL